MNVGGIGLNEYRNCAQETARPQQTERPRFSVTCNSTPGVSLDSGALFSMCHVPTGESINIYRAEDYAEDNPVYLVKGTDANGQEYERRINANEVNPNGSSYVEMAVLNVHMGKGDANFMLSTLRDGTESDTIFDRRNYIALVRKRMEQLRTLGAWSSYLRYDRWLSGILEKSRNFCDYQTGRRDFI